MSSASAGTRGDGDGGPDRAGSPGTDDWLETAAAGATGAVLGVRGDADPAALDHPPAPEHPLAAGRSASDQVPAVGPPPVADQALSQGQAPPSGPLPAAGQAPPSGLPPAAGQAPPSGPPPAAGQAPPQSRPSAHQPPAPRVLNAANALTVLRLALVPVVVWFLLSGGTGDRSVAFVAFALASVTDLLDGELARRWSLITDFGKIADPIADKALTGAALITLSYLGELPWWVTAVIVFRELAVTGLRFWVIRQGVIAASRGGKAKTMLQVIAISLYVLPVHLGFTRAIVMGAALVVTVVTGIDYTARAIRLHRAVQ